MRRSGESYTAPEMTDDTPIGEGYEAQSIETTHGTKSSQATSRSVRSSRAGDRGRRKTVQLEFLGANPARLARTPQRIRTRCVHKYGLHTVTPRRERQVKHRE